MTCIWTIKTVRRKIYNLVITHSSRWCVLILCSWCTIAIVGEVSLNLWLAGLQFDWFGFITFTTYVQKRNPIQWYFPLKSAGYMFTIRARRVAGLNPDPHEIMSNRKGFGWLSELVQMLKKVKCFCTKNLRQSCYVSGCGKVDSTVASETRRTGFESSLKFYWTIMFCQLVVQKTKVKKKRPKMAHLKSCSITLIGAKINVTNECLSM